MRWSVGIEAEGDRVLSREEVVELADAVAAEPGHRHRASAPAGTAPSSSWTPPAARRPSRRRPRSSCAPRARPGCPGRRSCGPRRSARTRTSRLDDPARVAGRLPVRGAAPARRVDAAAGPAVYAILYKPEPDTRPERYAVIYVGHADDLSAERFPFRHPRARVLGAPGRVRWKVYIATLRGAGRRPRRTGSRSPASSPRSTTRAATPSSTTRPGRTSGSASTPPRPPARSPAAARTRPDSGKPAPPIPNAPPRPPRVFAARACPGLSVAERIRPRRAGGTGACRTRAARARARPAARDAA